MFFQHGDPSGRIAPDHEGLVIGLGVAVDRSVPEHGVDASQHLVCSGDGGALVSPVHGECLVISLELASGGSGGTVGTLDEDAVQAGVPLASPA